MIDEDLITLPFDDLVVDEHSVWAYCCEKHSEDKEINCFGKLSEVAIDGCICGVKGCRNVAKNYLDIVE